MKQGFIFCILIISFSVFPYFLIGQETDSANVFYDMTDIESLVREKTQSQRDEVLNIMDGNAVDSLKTKPLSHFTQPLNTNRTVEKPLDSLYVRKANGTLQLPAYTDDQAMRGLTFADTIFYNPLFLPPVFMGNVLPRELSLYRPDKEGAKYALIPRERTFEKQLKRSHFIRGVRKQLYTSSPDLVAYSLSQLQDIASEDYERKISGKLLKPLHDVLETETTVSLSKPDVEGVKFRRRYWVWSGKHELLFSQNYFSDNWHKGGTSNMNIRNHHIIRLNYKKDKMHFNNLLEWRLSIFNAPEDSLRKFRIGEDFLRYYGDFGIDAFVKHWSYSTNLEVKTQLFNNYMPNSKDLRSSFLSPLYINAGVGMKYEIEKKSERVRHRKVKWELTLAPISLNYKYVFNTDVDLKRYGIPVGERYIFDVGSTINSLVNYNITRYITLESRFKYFTSYDKVEAEFENTFKFPLGNYLTTTFFLHMRYDDAVPMDPKFKHLQISQVVGIGFDYKW